MAQEVKLPELGESVTDGIVIELLVEVGDVVEVDQPLLEISTDKIDTEVPSPYAGEVTEILVAVDDEIQVGQTLMVIGGDESSSSASSGDEGAEADAEAESGGDSADGSGSDAPSADAAASDDDGGGSAGAAAYGASDPGVDAPAEKADGGTAPSDADFDLVVVGGGTGGYSTALRAAQLGLSVGLVEKAKVGGTCLHWGCIPTKAILQSAETAEVVAEAAEFGVMATFDAIEMTKVIEHQTSVVDTMHKGLQGTLKSRGVETIAGTASFVDAHTVEVELTEGGSRTVTCTNLVIATGSQPRELPFAPFDGEKILSSDHALFIEEVPRKVVILGSGAVGMEFATAWSAFGAQVIVVELEDRLLPLEDKDVSKEMAKQFRKRNVEARTGVKLTAVDTSGDGVVCTVEGKKGEEQIDADLLLVAVGRGPVTAGLGLEEMGVAIERGFVQVDEFCETSVSGVYAVGDVIPTLGLAHASFAEGIMVADQLAGLDVVPIDYHGVPRVTYSHPEVGSVGYSEEGAKEAGYEVVTEKLFFQGIARAMMMKASGIVKIVAEKDDSREGGAGRVLGIHIVGPKATDLIAEGQLIYNWEALPTDVAHFIHAHPSLGEALGEAHLALAGRALHG